MRKIRAIRLVVRLLLLVLTLSLSLVSFLGGLSAVMILSDQRNVGIPDGTPSGNLTLYDPSTGFLFGDVERGHIEFSLPFNITNAGYFTLQELKIRITITFIFDQTNILPPPDNVTKTIVIFDREIDFDPDLTGLASGETLKSNFSAKYNETNNGGFQNIDDLPGWIGDIDVLSNPPTYTADITMTCKYSVGLLSLRVDMYNLDLTTIGGS